MGTYREPEGLPLTGPGLLRKGEADSRAAEVKEESPTRKDKSIPSKTEGDKGPNI